MLTPKVIDGLYTEAMLLADEARGSFDGAARAPDPALSGAARVELACESMRVTTRLMHVIAWLLTQRAIAAGELAASFASTSEQRIGPPLPSAPEALAILPEAARALSRASSDLYERAARLDRGLVAKADEAGPARALLDRLNASL